MRRELLIPGVRHDVLVEAPSAKWPDLRPAPTYDYPTPEELVKMYAAEMRRLESELEQTRIAASTITNVALSLMVVYEVGETTTIPREVSDRVEGGQITIGENADRDLIVRRRVRMPHYLGEES